jgi:hypothetical protein
VLPTSEFDGATSDYEFAIRVGKISVDKNVMIYTISITFTS